MQTKQENPEWGLPDGCLSFLLSTELFHSIIHLFMSDKKDSNLQSSVYKTEAVPLCYCRGLGHFSRDPMYLIYLFSSLWGILSVLFYFLNRGFVERVYYRIYESQQDLHQYAVSPCIFCFTLPLAIIRTSVMNLSITYTASFFP